MAFTIISHSWMVKAKDDIIIHNQWNCWWWHCNLKIMGVGCHRIGPNHPDYSSFNIDEVQNKKSKQHERQHMTECNILQFLIWPRVLLTVQQKGIARQDYKFRKKTIIVHDKYITQYLINLLQNFPPKASTAALTKNIFAAGRVILPRKKLTLIQKAVPCPTGQG